MRQSMDAMDGLFGRVLPHAGAGRIPVLVFAGSLGAGKTTIIRELLRQPQASNSALVVNEFGAVGIDDALLRSSGEETVLLGNGCICCAYGSDFARTLDTLFQDRRAGRIGAFERVIVELSGVADPLPVLETLAADRRVARHFATSALITVIDAAHASNRLGAHATFETAGATWLRQVALADRIVLTRADEAGEAGMRRVLAALAAMHAQAEIAEARAGQIDPAFLLAPARTVRSEPIGEPGVANHLAEYRSFAIVRAAPLEWHVLSQALHALTALCGDRILRIKGLANVRGFTGPISINHAQRAAERPERLLDWPDGDRRTRLVVIARGLEPAPVRTLLEAFWAFDGSLEKEEPR